MALALYICASLKIFSYVHVNKMCRKFIESKNTVVIDKMNNNGNPREKIEGKMLFDH